MSSCECLSASASSSPAMTPLSTPPALLSMFSDMDEKPVSGYLRIFPDAAVPRRGEDPEAPVHEEDGPDAEQEPVGQAGRVDEGGGRRLGEDGGGRRTGRPRPLGRGP